MKFHRNLISRLVDQLPKKLGPQFEIMPEYTSRSFDGVEVKGAPDLVVYNRDKHQVTLLGVTGTNQSDDLPFAVISSVRRMKELNQDLNAKVMLISTSRITPLLRGRLESSDIDFVEGDREEVIVSQVANRIAERAEQPVAVN